MYWMVDTGSIEEKISPTSFDAVYLKSTGGDTISYFTVGLEGIKTFQGAGGYFTTQDISGYSSSSFFVELYNSGAVVGSSEIIPYSTLQSLNAIYETGIGAGGGNPYSFSSFAVPEPNSGILVLIGVALTSLRRRRNRT